MDMDAIVTARVPVGVKEEANAILKQIGATTTDLVRAAFDFLLQERKLPVKQLVKQPAGTKRKLIVRRPTAAQKAKFQAFVARSTMKLPAEFANMDYKEIKWMRLKEKYGTVA
jgi:antitoxin component of RelBE/YafQ-DinJ toxin-antitoxin module